VIKGLVDGAPGDALTWREADGAWSVVEVVMHLADGEITDWIPRMDLMLAGGGRFAPYDREGGFRRYSGWQAPDLVREFTRLRRDNLEKLARLRLSARHLSLTGEHPEFGTVTLSQLLACWAAHDAAHAAQISRILTRWFGRGVGPWAKYFSLLRSQAADAQA
jgi:hypothetical protein